MQKPCTAGRRLLALAGNPNVGKSTVFNAITGMHQHTGNWTGKTVSLARGTYTYEGTDYELVDIPGTYSLLAQSADERVARDFLCFGGCDGVILVCDATNPERNLNLLLQTLEITSNVVLCLNLCDEAKKKGIEIDAAHLSRLLGIPVVLCAARSRKGIPQLLQAAHEMLKNPPQGVIAPRYCATIEAATALVEDAIGDKTESIGLPARWVAMRLLDYDESLIASLNKALGYNLLAFDSVTEAMRKARSLLRTAQLSGEALTDQITGTLVHTAEHLYRQTVSQNYKTSFRVDRKIDRIISSRLFGFPLMLLMLCLVLWITISGANIPSAFLADCFQSLEDWLWNALAATAFPPLLRDLLLHGVLRVLGWVVAVMLPPMAIFFPLFTILEDLGYLPRVAFNLDRCFCRAKACGKQALTMCQSFGCNAVGIEGCRIIDSPREKLIAILTNAFIPCNGRFPTLILLITMFFAVGGGAMASLQSAALLTALIVLGIAMTFLISALLSKTILRGVPSFFTIELPPYRAPQVGRVIVRSIFDRTLFVLGRAVVVAAPAGLIIWLMANCHIGGISVLAHCADFLEPFAALMGLDGVILLAFILGFPANEIVIPVALMAYLAQGALLDVSDPSALKAILLAQGWTWKTAVSTMLFSLMHWPCSTTCLTIYKETKSAKWTLLAILIPSVVGIAVCMGFTGVCALFGA